MPKDKSYFDKILNKKLNSGAKLTKDELSRLVLKTKQPQEQATERRAAAK